MAVIDLERVALVNGWNAFSLMVLLGVDEQEADGVLGVIAFAVSHGDDIDRIRDIVSCPV